MMCSDLSTELETVNCWLQNLGLPCYSTFALPSAEGEYLSLFTYLPNLGINLECDISVNPVINRNNFLCSSQHIQQQMPITLKRLIKILKHIF